MTAMQMMAEGSKRGVEMVKMLLSDFSDADMLARPCPGANHAAWQLGHAIAGETMMVSACGGAMPELPAGFAEKFDSKKAGVDDPKAFPAKAELLDLLGRARAATARWMASLSEADLAKPGPERMREYAPTVGSVAGLVQGHLMMHAGQIQVIRRKLGKPVMF